MTIDCGGENVFPTHPLASYSLYSNKLISYVYEDA